MEKGKNSRESSGPSYEVFLSFRGPDTRHGFTDCLYHGMLAAGILVFRDDESLRVGERIGGELLQAIEKSKIYIPIFSTNYASSHWCLRELTHMIKCTTKSNGNKEILPIFFDVEPVDVKLKTDLYRKTLAKCQKRFSRTDVESWERALIEVGEIKGWNLGKDQGQGDLIQSVIQAVLVKLNVGYKNVTEHLVGVDHGVEAIINMLNVEYGGVRYLTIHGMGGVGKTTLAKVVFNQLSPQFQGCNFLSDVRESLKRCGPEYLPKQLLSKFLDSRSVDQIHDVDYGINMVKRVLSNKKVLIVLDDIDEEKKLKSLVGKGNWVGFGSRIIITTRNKSFLTIDEETTGEGPAKSAAIFLTYEVQEMEYHHALKLFSKHAFRRDFPPDDYVSLSEKIVSALGKLPLALEVTGSTLSGKPREFWVDTLEKLENAPSIEVKKSLMISYDRLDTTQKKVFLDIACFFVNENKTYPIYMWHDCKFFPHDAIEVLYLMSLIKIKDNNTFWMHDQVRDLGRAIVCEENIADSSDRSRVWNHQEALNILKQKEGSRKIEALSLGCRGDIVTCDEVANLRKLRFLEANGVFLVGDFSNVLSNLRWLTWQWCPYEFVATNFHLDNLVILDLSQSYISEKWNGWNQIGAASKLKILDLSNCNYLERTPDLSMLVLLERLTLEGCRNLIEIDPSIGKLKHLTTLNLNGCQSLKELPKEIGCLEAFTEILTPCSPHEFKFPETFGNLKSLLTFDVSHSQITKHPCSIGGLVKLQRLNLSECTKMKELPDSVGKLQSLVELDLSLSSLGHLPDSISNLKQLKQLRMSRMRRITKLPDTICLLEKLEELYADYCWNLTGKIPPDIRRLSRLKILDLSCTRISGLPYTMGYLSSLQTLNLESCQELEKLPFDLPPGLTCLKWTRDPMKFFEGMRHVQGSVPPLRTTISPPSQLEELKLSPEDMLPLFRLPSSLLEIELGNLEIVQVQIFSNLTKLATLRLECCLMSGCNNWYYQYELERKHVEMGAPIQLQMERLGYLEMRGCEFLSKVLDLFFLKDLQEVHLLGCKFLVEICGLEELGSLCFLSVVEYSSVEKMSDLSKLRKLRKLRVGKCPKLTSVEGVNHLESLQKLWIYDCSSLESLSDTSNLHLQCCTIERCKRLPGRTSYCRCHDNSDSLLTELDHSGYF